VLIVLFLFGGASINDFVFVMLAGVVVGTYSSIFIASPIVAVGHKRRRGQAKTPEKAPVSAVIEA
jgi:SecD/SecF fusion protein